MRNNQATERAKIDKPSYLRIYIVFPVIIVVLAIIIGFLYVPRYFSAKTVKITGVQKEFRFAWIWADEKVNGKMQEIHYYSLRLYVNIENSNSSDATNVELVVHVKVDSSVIVSEAKKIGTLKAGASRHALFHLLIPHIQLLDATGNYKGDITAVITLYSGNEVLEQITTGVL